MEQAQETKTIGTDSEVQTVNKRKSVEEKREIVEPFEISVKTRAAFCREEGIGYLTFGNWLKK